MSLDLEIKKTLKVLKKGGTVLYPTDTIWGIGCDATNSKAVEKVYALKKREHHKAMIVLLADFNDLEKYVSEIPEITYDLIHYINRPLTIVYDGARNLASNLINSDGSIAIRIVNHIFCCALIREFGKPIVSTSANFSQSPSPLFYSNVNDEIKSKVDYIVNLDQEFRSTNQASTIIKLDKTGNYTVIRE